MKFHPFSEVLPMIEGTDFEALVKDITANGLREKIVLFDGKVLDGRNRFLACQKAKVPHKFRHFKGSESDALAFVVSANLQRRHLTAQQRAMAAAKIATLQHGQRSDRVDASREASKSQVSESTTQNEAAKKLDVSRSSVQRARKVQEKGSKALQKAVESGDVSLKKAAAVVDLPKRDQVAAAKAKPPEPEPDLEILSDGWEPDEDLDAELAQAEKAYAESIDKVMAADDKLAAAHEEIKRQAAEIASLRQSRDGYQNGKATVTALLKKEKQTTKRLLRQLDKANAQIEALQERTAIMEAS